MPVPSPIRDSTIRTPPAGSTRSQQHRRNAARRPRILGQILGAVGRDAGSKVWDASGPSLGVLLSAWPPRPTARTATADFAGGWALVYSIYEVPSCA
jgi:hypothetical protein